MRDSLNLKRDQMILLETKLNDAEHRLAGTSNRSSEINSQANLDQADARHKSVKAVSKVANIFTWPESLQTKTLVSFLMSYYILQILLLCG